MTKGRRGDHRPLFSRRHALATSNGTTVALVHVVGMQIILFATSLLGAAVHPQSVPVQAPASPQRCSNESSAREYERKAEQYAAEAEHFRALADIEEKYSRTEYGKYAARFYREKADEMDIAAENSLNVAMEHRMQADAGQEDQGASCGDVQQSAEGLDPSSDICRPRVRAK